MSDKGSVFQKGGGGTNFEQSIQAAFLTSLIIRGNAPCLPSNEIVEVSFQNTSKGYETDDLLIVSKSVLGKHRLLIQIKHTISFTPGNTIFKEVIQSFWKDYLNTALFDRTKDKLIVVKNGLTKEERNHLKSIFNWANTHATEIDFVAEVERIKGKKEWLEIFRGRLKEANNDVGLNDKELWEFLKCMDVLEYDFLNNGSVDEAHFLNLIKLSKTNESSQNEKEIWNDILAVVSKLNKDGGNATTESIQKEVVYKNFSIEKLNPYFKSVQKLKSDSEAILKPLKNTIGDLHINRYEIKDTIINSFNTYQFTIVTGKPGVGKSAEVKGMLMDGGSSSNTFAFRADQFNQPHIANVFSSQGINETIQDIFSCISLFPDKIIFIDSLEKLLEADPECAFKQLLGLLKEFPDIKVIASSRKYAIDLLIQKFGIDNSQLGIVEVLPLSEEELKLVSIRFPQIDSVLKNLKIKKLLTSPKYLDFAISALAKFSDDYSNITLTEFKNRLWNSLVVDTTNTKDGMPIKREAAFMEIAVKRAKEMKLFTQIYQSDAEAIQLLERDEILFQENQNRKYGPAHDILEDWALIRYVSSVYEDNNTPKELFKKLGNEPAIRRAFRLWVEDYLIDNNDTINEFIKEALKDDTIEKYWADELLVAVFKSEDCRNFFSKHKKILLEDDARLLNRCIHLIKTCCKESNLKDNDFSILLPIGSGWKEALCFLNKNIDHLDHLRLSITNFMGDWGYVMIFRYSSISQEELRDVKAIVIKYIYQIESEEKFWQQEFVKEKTAILIDLLFNLSGIAKDEIKQLVERAFSKKEKHGYWRANTFSETLIEKCLSGIGNQRLTKELPEVIVETAWKEWKSRPIKKPPTDSIVAMLGYTSITHEKCWGIEDKFRFHPSGTYKTPFYNLLWHHPLTGLKFITEFINYSLNFYVKADCEYKHSLKQIEIMLPDNTRVMQWAGKELWVAYRGLSVTHYAIESLLMSLEKYLLETAGKKTENSKANLKFLFDYLLRHSNNVSTVGVLASVSMAYPKEVEEAILPVLACKEFYNWDLNRALEESRALSPFDTDLSFAQEERWQLNQLPHRRKYTRGLMDFILDYQFNIRILNKEIHLIFDKLKENISPEDVVWKKIVTEMDVRNHKIGQYDEKIGGFPIEPQYEEDVVKFIDDGRASYEDDTSSLNYSYSLTKAYERKEQIDFIFWQTCYVRYLDKGNFTPLYDRPVTLAVLGLRDFFSSLNKLQIDWCVNTLQSTIASILQDSFDRDFDSNTLNFFEKEIALTSSHLLFGATKSDKDKNELVLMMIYLMFAPMGDHEVSYVTEYMRTIFFKHHPTEGKRIWYGLIKYSQYRKANHYFYDDQDSKRLQIAKQKEAAFINGIVTSKELKIDLSDVNLKVCQGSLLARAFAMTPYYIADSNFADFIKHFIPLLISDLQQKESYSYGEESEGRQIVPKAVLNCKSFLVELMLKADSEFAKQVLDSILNPFYESDTGMRLKDDLREFLANILEYVIYKLNDVVLNSKDEVAKPELISNFWKLWHHLFERIKGSGKSYFINYLFLDVRFGDSLSQWLPLEGKKDFYHELVETFGATHTKSIIRVFSTIGEKEMLPEGLSWLVEIYRKNDELALSLASVSAERLIKRLFYNHISVIKRNKVLTDDLIWLLNKMVDFGSSEAYLFRENVITYKQAV